MRVDQSVQNDAVINQHRLPVFGLHGRRVRRPTFDHPPGEFTYELRFLTFGCGEKCVISTGTATFSRTFPGELN